MKPASGQQGQVVLIGLLVLSFAVTVALSIVGRSTSDVAISNQLDESSRAFSAAEAGIEEALNIGTATSGALDSGASYDVLKEDAGGGRLYVYPEIVRSLDAATLWFVNHNADGTRNETPTYTAGSIDVCWSSASVTPAMLVSVFYKSGSDYRVARGAYDPDETRTQMNKFSAAATPGCGEGTDTAYKQTITFSDFSIVPSSDTLLMLRLQPVYAEATIAVSASRDLPTQGATLSSSGTVESGITRKIVVYQQYRSAPSAFDSLIFSQGAFGH